MSDYHGKSTDRPCEKCLLGFMPNPAAQVEGECQPNREASR